jgi:hypothetical protein
LPKQEPTKLLEAMIEKAVIEYMLSISLTPHLAVTLSMTLLVPTPAVSMYCTINAADIMTLLQTGAHVDLFSISDTPLVLFCYFCTCFVFCCGALKESFLSCRRVVQLFSGEHAAGFVSLSKISIIL